VDAAVAAVAAAVAAAVVDWTRAEIPTTPRTDITHHHHHLNLLLWLHVLSLSVGFESVLRPLELHLEPLGAHLEAVHGLDGGERAHRVVVRHEPEALGEVGLLVNEHLGADDGAERIEGLQEVRVAELLGKVVDEQVRAVGALMLLHRWRHIPRHARV